MQKGLTFIIIGIFLLLMLGLGISVALSSFFPGAPLQISSEPIPLTQQLNILIVEVNDLSIPNPVLISAWGMFFSRSKQQPSIIFQILTPDKGDEAQSQLANNFELKPGKIPSSGFMDKTLSANHLSKPWDAYILVDHEGLQKFSDWSGMSSNQTLETFLPELCYQMENSDSIPEITFHWGEIIPNHLKTNLSFETAVMIWDTAFHSPKKIFCDVYHQ